MFRRCLQLCICVSLPLVSNVVVSDTWVFEPAVGLSVGFDDNYGLDFKDSREVTSQRASFELSAKRVSRAFSFRGVAKVDATAYQGDLDDDVDSNSNQVLYFSANKNTSARSRIGTSFNYKHDNLNREAVINEGTDPGEELDGNSSDVVSHDISRHRLVIRPYITHQYSRLMDLRFDYGLRAVEHEDVDVDEADFVEPTNYIENSASFAVGYRITPVDKISTRLQYSVYETDDDTEEFNTSILRLGYQRSFSETLKINAEVGIRSTEYTDDGDTGTVDGSVFSVSATKSYGLTQYRLRASRDLVPSSLGQVLQADELVANVTRNITELLDFSIRSRAYENTFVSESESTNKTINNNRRFISIAPKLTWRFARGWSTSASYRYRREKVVNDPTPAESNSVLFSIKYTKLSPLTNK